ncbi:hypothetical protein UMM65_04210 [Aureibaculum sp. 2210JD6-5]|uniref:hypothetical protein n=1 Tax=Aureibaculum sp. 2210JD6-5 TaxID=3103957 RepID=UPI002AAEC4B4|nr:hypothetical protein [Aureibaculum sp. 2210JD6-5]MDY7394433.1 hypothetical protein [Aureibaculum sp. 2210JD6-5]
MKYICFSLILFLISSCIPLRIAPTIEDYKLTTGKKFKKHLPRDEAFVFEDPKDASEFYNFINTKYSLNHKTVEYNVPIHVEGGEFYMSFYEVEIPTKTINLLPIAVDATLKNKGLDPMLQGSQFTRKGNWYLALFVYDANMKDCLKSDYPSRKGILNYLKALKKEYLNTHNYLEAMMKMK